MSQQEICRHFLRGSCRFGARCRYSHAIPNQNQNQSKNSSPNPFGFGSAQFSQQQQQQKSNPFGFGVQNRNSTAQFQPPSKPFDNKWTRQTSAGSKQADPQSQASVHTCTDPESCKQIVAEDFKNEAPQWKLTCYAHYKHLPCDVHSDISTEELRAVAYEEAKHGRSLHSIVERERNLLQSRLSEFENLLRSPFVTPTFTIFQQTNGNQASAANFGCGKGSDINAHADTTGSQLFSSLSASSSNPSNKQQLLSLSLGFTSASPPPEEEQEDSMDDSIWLKERWSIGEIPERAPPLRFCTRYK